MSSNKTKRQELLDTVKKNLFPFMVSQGYAMHSKNGSGGIYDFHKIMGCFVHLIQIQFDKNGEARFKINMGISTEKTIPSRFHGTINIGSITCSHLPIELKACLKEGSATNTRHWFRSDRLVWFNKQTQKEAACAEVIHLWPNAEGWFSEMKVLLDEKK